jgi:hypothetical protein
VIEQRLHTRIQFIIILLVRARRLVIRRLIEVGDDTQELDQFQIVAVRDVSHPGVECN